uniref:Tripartite motif-containing protein 16-like n=1 Tax=Erpetoichthys calabaricus TaxID=27687 RepID=A0A8C4X3F7_ERPCA
MMAEAQLFVSQDEFTCSVCLDTLTEPVTILCGHNFCLKCLTDYWDQSQECSCPQCRLGSCLTCMASYCQTHLQPHYEVAALKHHKLVDPDRNLKEKFCGKHQKSLEMFCRTDKTFICLMCAVTEHNSHEKFVLETEREGKKVSVKQKMEEHDKSFTALIQCIEEAHKKLTEKIREQEKRNIEKAEGVMEQLEKEIEELKRKDAELKELSKTKDHIHFLQVRVTLHRESDQTGVCGTREFSKSREVRSFYKYPVTHTQISSLVFFSLLSDFYPLTLDINTAHRDLRLSEGNKKVTCEGTKANYPDHTDRFDCWEQVLCREALTGIRCYWEVECSGDFMMIGVAYKGLSSKGKTDDAPYSPRIGVYLDWPAGSLSFYSVSHTMTLLHRFNTSFTEPLYPGFGFGRNSSVTISHLTSCDH